MDITEPPEHIRKAFRRSLLEEDEWDLLAATRAGQEVQDLMRYVLAIEQMVDHQERSEMEALEAESKSPDCLDASEFWAWHYPSHWDQIVRGMFRASAIITLVSFVETTLSQISRDVRIITQEELKGSDLNGAAIEKSKKYLKRFGGFTIDEAIWRQIDDIVQVRNAFVHFNGDIDLCRSPQRIRNIVAKGPGLEEAHGAISVDKRYLEHVLKSVEGLVWSLSKEMRALCGRRRTFVEKNDS